MTNFTLSLKTTNPDPEAMFHVVRLADGFLLDEVLVKNLRFGPGSGRGESTIVLDFDYVRHGQRFRDLAPCVLTSAEFAEARQASMVNGQPSKEAFAKSRVFDRLFADGARQFLERQVTAKEDTLEDVEFINRLIQ
jgi:hypothetical protein